MLTWWSQPEEWIWTMRSMLQLELIIGLGGFTVCRFPVIFCLLLLTQSVWATDSVLRVQSYVISENDPRSEERRVGKECRCESPRGQQQEEGGGKGRQRVPERAGVVKARPQP